jgi:hypothetical protein
MANYRVPELDSFEWQQAVSARTNVAPTGPAKGSRYLCTTGPAATGPWNGFDNDIVICTATDPTWDNQTPTEGMITWVSDENKYYYFTGTVWKELTQSDAGTSGNTFSFLLMGG